MTWGCIRFGGVVLLLCGMGPVACGVSPDVYRNTLHERDQLRQRLEQVEATAASAQAALTAQQQANQELRSRVAELEALTADQTLAAEALTQQLRSVMAEREALLLRIAEIEEQLARQKNPDAATEPDQPRPKR
jgi:septal ring factor EnvC (AmiA/AmiB activator)